MRGLRRSGATGFLVASVAALLVIVGLWAVAREGPSAKNARAPVVAPTPTPTPTARPRPAGVGQLPFPTARPARVRAVSVRSPTAAPSGWLLPRRRSAVSSVSSWDLVVGGGRPGDATGVRNGAAGVLSPAARPGAMTPPSRLDRTER